MRVSLIRHGMTAGNRLHRYIGRTDEPLCSEGIESARAAGIAPDVREVFVTPLARTQETARIMFPYADQRVIPGLREMDFGVFENRNADEMVDDTVYREWVDGMCLSPCPQGESLGEFKMRVCAAFEHVIDELMERDASGTAVFLVHGGTVMTLLEHYARPKRGFYDYIPKNCGGVSGDILTVSGENPDVAQIPFAICHIMTFEHMDSSVI